jgi:nucleoside-diphosphate-sugar epimerase
VVIHQLTDLPSDPDPKKVGAALARNARLRIEGTRNLMRAAAKVGMRRVIAQSIAFAYAPGGAPHRETDPLNLAVKGDQLVTVQGVLALERDVRGTPGIEGIVLRYGRLYGPGTWTGLPKGEAPLHADAAAHAALLALDHGHPGIYNIAEADGAVSSDKARRELGFRPDFRLPSA